MYVEWGKVKLRRVETLSDKNPERKAAILEVLYRDYERALRSFLYGRVRSESDIDDIVHEIFERISRLDELQEHLLHSTEKSRAYLFTAANNLVVDHERRRAVRRRYQSEQSSQSQTVAYELSPDVVVSATQELSAVKAAIRELDPNWRQAFLLARFKGLSRKDISAVMGVSIRQVENYITKALKALRRAVPNRGGDYE